MSERSNSPLSGRDVIFRRRDFFERERKKRVGDLFSSKSPALILEDVPVSGAELLVVRGGSM